MSAWFSPDRLWFLDTLVTVHVSPSKGSDTLSLPEQMEAQAGVHQIGTGSARSHVLAEPPSLIDARGLAPWHGHLRRRPGWRGWKGSA